jgi:hypothetical protein
LEDEVEGGWEIGAVSHECTADPGRGLSKAPVLGNLSKKGIDIDHLSP